MGDGEVFTSVYRTDYRGHPGHKRQGLLLPLDIYSSGPQDDNFIHPEAKDKSEWCGDPDELIKRLYANRMRTVYRVSYCREHETSQKPHSEKEVSSTDISTQQQPQNEDVLITYFDELFKLPKTQKLLAPLPTSRRVYGYCRPSLLYTQLTEYQAIYCKCGFNILKRDFDRGINRLGSRKKKLEDIPAYY